MRYRIKNGTGFSLLRAAALAMCLGVRSTLSSHDLTPIGRHLSSSFFHEIILTRLGLLTLPTRCSCAPTRLSEPPRLLKAIRPTPASSLQPRQDGHRKLSKNRGEVGCQTNSGIMTAENQLRRSQSLMGITPSSRRKCWNMLILSNNLKRREKTILPKSESANSRTSALLTLTMHPKPSIFHRMGQLRTGKSAPTPLHKTMSQLKHCRDTLRP